MYVLRSYMNLSDNRPKVGRVKNDCLGRLRRFGGMAVREDGKITGNGRCRFSGAVSGCAASSPESDARTRRLGGVVGKTGRGSCEGAGRSGFRPKNVGMEKRFGTVKRHPRMSLGHSGMFGINKVVGSA